MVRRRWLSWAVLLGVAATLAVVSGVTAQVARADDPTAVELVGDWFGNLTTPVGTTVPVELQVLSAENRRFTWRALEDFGPGVGFAKVATGYGTVSASGESQIKGDGLAGNLAGLAEISAHGIVQGTPGSLTANFGFRGMNTDGTKINGAIILVLQPAPESG